MNETPNWHKSSYSGGANDSCIEVADNQPGVTLVRDTKDHSKGIMNVSSSAWGMFVRSVVV